MDKGNYRNQLYQDTPHVSGRWGVHAAGLDMMIGIPCVDSWIILKRGPLSFLSTQAIKPDNHTVIGRAERTMHRDMQAIIGLQKHGCGIG
jgi:hypothetical protein